jgi:hypothetical protein
LAVDAALALCKKNGKLQTCREWHQDSKILYAIVSAFARIESLFLLNEIKYCNADCETHAGA